MKMVNNGAAFAGYVLPALRQPRVGIDNLVFDDLGEAVLRIHNERFKGVLYIEDTREYKPNQPISYSNVPRVFSYNSILHELTGGNIKIFGPEQVVQYGNQIPERTTTYADTDAIAVFTRKGPNEAYRKVIQDIIGMRSSKIPVFVSGLGVEKADNKEGFNFIETDFIDLIPAPYLTKDQKITYDPKKGLVAAQEGVHVWVSEDKSGIRRVYRDGDGVLGCRDEDLLNSDVDGRVQVVQHPKGRAPAAE